MLVWGSSTCTIGSYTRTHIGVGVVYEHTQRGKDLLDRVHRRRRVFIAAQVDNHPRDVAQEADGNCGIDER